MKLLEAIIEANHRALHGDKAAGLRPTEHADALPLAALTCIDARLNPLVPEVFGIPEDKFIWLRNAGNIITGPLSSTMRSLALACAVKGAREIAIVGHTDCLVAKTNALDLTDRFQKLGVPRQQLPENLNEFFGLFASERQNVLKAVEFVRQSPLIGPAIPVHGLMIDIQTGRLEWLANGYEQPAKATATPAGATAEAGPAVTTDWQPIGHFENFKQSEFAPPTEEIGAARATDSLQSERRAEQELRSTAPVGDSTRGATGQLIDKARRWMSEVQLVEGQSLKETVSQVGRASVTTVRELAELIDRNHKYHVIGSDLKEYGPIAGFKLVQWLMEDRITPDSPVKPEGSGEWHPLKSLVGGAMKKHLKVPPPLENFADRVAENLRRRE